jgi:hypothetical protein
LPPEGIKGKLRKHTMANSPEETTSQPRTVDATPTKDFFISMLVRDIELVDAVADLFDNCVDGARRVRPGGTYDGLFVRMEATKEHFRITDNCGGIGAERARSYAFRIGRPTDAKLAKYSLKHSLGQFGIGMKRALFKLGKKFTVESRSGDSSFKLSVDVEKWKRDNQRGLWSFEFDSVQEGISVPPDDQGTDIEVTMLNPGVAAEFNLENFRNRLREELEAKHERSLEKGLRATLNGANLEGCPPRLLSSTNLAPAHVRRRDMRGSSTPVSVELYVGISDSDPSAGGWYVYCNDRLVLEADQTKTTGWGERGVTPRYHNQYARFRGYALFDCDNAGLLPWNTTKTGMALDNSLYQSVRQRMVGLMVPVKKFLDDLKKEEQLAKITGRRPLAKVVESTPAVALSGIPLSRCFRPPETPTARVAPKTGTISYRKPLDEIDRAKKMLKVRSRREVGERTFDYYLKFGP